MKNRYTLEIVDTELGRCAKIAVDSLDDMDKSKVEHLTELIK